MPRCLTTAMSHGASRTTSSMVGLKTAAPDERPPQPKMTRSASSSAAASTMPSAARRPMRTIVWSSTPSGVNSSTRCRRRRAWRARVAPSLRGMPSGTSTIERAVRLPPWRSSAAPMRTRSAAVRGLASGRRMRAGPPSRPPGVMRAGPNGAPVAAGRVGEGVAAGAAAAVQRATNEGLSSSKARAWRSTNASASSVVRSRVSRTRLATRPK